MTLKPQAHMAHCDSPTVSALRHRPITDGRLRGIVVHFQVTTVEKLWSQDCAGVSKNCCVKVVQPATILAQSRSILRESTFRVFVLYIGQSRFGDKGFTVSGVNPKDPKAQKLQYTPHMNPLRTRHNDVVFANGGGCAPPQPPRCLCKPCRLAFKNIAP